MTTTNTINIHGARVNNLRNISIQIPRNRLVVITGLSGSGKSSLAFDTLYAEGQRRYVESLNSYARQFLGRMAKPDCDTIEGIPPAIAIEQKVIARNPRSTVGTSTEIYDYLRMLFARIGRTYSPISGQEVRKHTIDDIITTLATYSQGTRYHILAPLHIAPHRTLRDQLQAYHLEGFTRLDISNQVVRIDDYLQSTDLTHLQATLKPGEQPPTTHRLLIDRLAVSQEPDTISRLTDSAETAFYEGHGQLIISIQPAAIEHTFTTRFEADGITFEEPTDQLFAFNSPMGACPQCQGWGNITGIDPNLVIPNTELSIYDGCVQCWHGEKLGQWRKAFIQAAEAIHFPIFKPYYQLTHEERNQLWHSKQLPSIDTFFDDIRSQRHKIQNRVLLARYTGKTECPTCHGGRLRQEATYVRVGNRTLPQLTAMPISQLQSYFHDLQLTPHEQTIAQRLLHEITTRLQFLTDVGLAYLTLSRPSNTLSGGESQRINLATSLGSSLVGSLYILDEPSIGLHPRDTERLIHVLRQLVDLGNTVVVVEHDEDIMRAADYIIDLGPDAGSQGGEIVYAGPYISPDQRTPEQQQATLRSHTIAYLDHTDQLLPPPSRRPWNRAITIHGARANNLKGIDVTFPLNVITCVTGVSGSGKSTLVRDILYNALRRHLGQAADHPAQHTSLTGDIDTIHAVEFINQNPIGKSTRSNPVIYIKAYDDIRRLYADQPLARQMGYTPAHFSFNTDGGRCDECKGEGTVTIEMQFMADLTLTCESCHGQRFKRDILDVRFHGKNISDVLDMTVTQAIHFFTTHNQPRIAQRLQPLADVGLSYIKLGQSSSTLSGGENQRVKLATYISQDHQAPTLFIFDEPTTGLHFHDIRRLLTAFDALIAKGHTIIIIEHNLDVIKMADHIIDLGPEGGTAGGQLITCGTPEQVSQHPTSHTAHHLRPKLTVN